MTPQRSLFTIGALACLVGIVPRDGLAQDWPQWRGAGRDAKAVAFGAPKTWPEALTKRWSVAVGEGVASPALVGERLYVFSRQDGYEVLRCLAATDGRELWIDKYEALGASGPAQGFSGPRSSPAVSGGKVVTLGVRGMLSCLDAALGRVLWRKDDFHSYPRFHPSSSPIIVGDLAMAQLGGSDNGALVAYDLASGQQRWRWDGPSPSYASPAALTVDGTTLIIAQTESKLVAVNAADGSLVWELAAAGPGGGGGGGGRGGGRDYRAASPVIEGSVLIVAGRGVTAFKFEKTGGTIAARELWTNPNDSVQFNTPILKDGLLYGLAPNNDVFCLSAADGKDLWSAPLPGGAGDGNGSRAALDPVWTRRPPGGVFGQAGPGDGEPRRRPGSGPGGGRGGGRMGGGTGYGSLVDAESVLLALTPIGQLVVLEPSRTGLKALATYRVAAGQTHAYPIASGNRVFIKDGESVTLWTVN